jgi:hypothetical protein
MQFISPRGAGNQVSFPTQAGEQVMPSFKTLLLAVLALSMSASYPVAASCQPVPDTITLNENGKLFQPFSFNHAKHIQMIKECSDCHHHTTGTLVLDQNCIRCHQNSSPTKVVSCRGCHLAAPFSPEALAEKRADPRRFHLDKIGLKGAMHQNCIGCHQRQAAGPVGCQGCHPRSKAGDAFYNSDKTGAKGAER